MLFVKFGAAFPIKFHLFRQNFTLNLPFFVAIITYKLVNRSKIRLISKEFLTNSPKIENLTLFSLFLLLLSLLFFALNRQIFSLFPHFSEPAGTK